MFFVQREVGYHAVFAYLLGDRQTGEAVVVDPADNVDELIELARINGLRIDRIINTHGHVDHVMGNREMQQKTGAKIWIHEEEAAYLEKIGEFWLNMFQAQKSPPASHTFTHDEVIRVGRHEWKVIHTPGHTPGSVCLYNREHGYCLSGDTLFVGDVGRTDGPRSSLDQMVDAIHDRILTLPAETKIFPGHNYGVTPTSTVAREKEHNPVLNDQLPLSVLRY